MAIQTPYMNLSALVIDDMAVQQTTLRGQLAMLGLSKIDAAGTPDDALRMIRARPYALVLCDYNLNHKTDGQQLLEYVREQGLLTAECLFFMVTAENAYASVASTTDHKPDAYLLKPITAGDIEERLKAQLERQRALLPINERLTRNDRAGALAECEKLLARKDRWFMQALQLKAQTLLQLGRHEDAKAVYLSALAQRSQLLWAQLGLAQAHKAAGAFEEAKLVAGDIINTKGGEKNVAAYDIVAESLEAQGDLRGAQRMLSEAAAVVPSAKRLRMVGESAYRNGDLELAKTCLAKVAKATRGALTAQAQDTLSLAQVLVDRGELQEAFGLLDDSAAAQRSNAQFEPVAQALRAQAHAKAGDTAAAAAAAQRAREALRTGKADFATVALAKAELMTGNAAAGLELLKGAVTSDHDNARVKALIRNALNDTGHAAEADALIDGATAGLTGRVADAKRLFRESRIDEALALIEAAAKDFPDNTTVLLQAAQINCMTLRLRKRVDAAAAERVRLYLSRLERLLPASDRVTQMQRYYRETMAGLASMAVAA